MNLDLPTLMVMQSFALACAGAVLLVAWLQNRKDIRLALWGIAHIVAAARHSFTDARVYFASAGLVGSRRHFATIPSQA